MCRVVSLLEAPNIYRVVPMKTTRAQVQSDNSPVIHVHVVQPNSAVKTTHNMLLVLLFMIVFSLEDSL